MSGNASQLGACWGNMTTRNLGQMFPKPKFSWTPERTSWKKCEPMIPPSAGTKEYFQCFACQLTRIEFERIRKIPRKRIRPASIFINGNKVQHNHYKKVKYANIGLCDVVYLKKFRREQSLLFELKNLAAAVVD